MLRTGFISALMTMVVTSVLLADEAHLVSGGSIEGTITSAENEPLVIVKTPFGRIATPTASVERIAKASPHEATYHLLAAETADTAKAQWELAQWCADHDLPKHRLPHLRRTIELNENHVRARAALGFTFHDGEWVLVGERLQEDGYVFTGGKWLSPHDVVVLRETRTRVEAERKWVARTASLINMLKKTNRQRAAEELQAIDDIHALPALVQRYREPHPRYIRVLFLQAIENINDPQAHRTLIQLTLYEPDEELAHLCIQAIREKVSDDQLIETFTDLLQSENKFEINRAAWVLTELNAEVAMPQLISALVTSHVVANARPEPTIVRKRKQRNDIRPEVRGSFRNPQVLVALNQLSGGENFGYDQKKWEGWLAIQNRDQLAAKAPR